MEQTNPPAADGQSGAFDIVATYQALLSSDRDMTMPVAAIESLVQLLAATPSLTTVSETMDVLESNIRILKDATPNAISLSAGTDLFTRYIITSLRPGSSVAGGDFAAIRQHLLSNAKVFVSRAKEARNAVAARAQKFIKEDTTVLTTGGSRAVLSTLMEAAGRQTRDGGAPRFKVIYVINEGELGESSEAVAKLRALSVSVAVIPSQAVAYCMSKVSMAIVGAEGVVMNGGIISRLGTYQLTSLVHSASKPVYVAVESHKFSKLFPLGQFDLGIDQNILDFSSDVTTPKLEANKNSLETPRPEYFDKAMASASSIAVDYTPPEHITALITEGGVMTTPAVAEELIKIYF